MRRLELNKDAVLERIGYRPHAGQARVHASRALRRVVCAGTRWGKSEAAAAEAVYALLQPRESCLMWTAAPTLDLTDRVFRRVVAWIDHAFKHRVLSYVPRERTLVVRNLGGGTSTLKAKTCDTPAGLLGEALDLLVLDECSRVPASVWHGHLAARLLDRRGAAFLISTPRGKDWFFKEWRRGQKGRDADYESWKAPTVENPFIDPMVVEAERARLPEATYRAEYLGEFLGDGTEPCDTCHGPKVGASAVIILEGDAEPPRCPECNNCVDEYGETRVELWPNGQSNCVIIALHERDEPPPPLPVEEPRS